MKPSIIYAFSKVLRALQSSKTLRQLVTANKMRIAFNEMFLYGRLAHKTRDHDKAEFYVKELIREYMNQTEKIAKNENSIE